MSRILSSPISRSATASLCKGPTKSALRQRLYHPTTAVLEPLIHNFYEPVTGTWQYVVEDERTKRSMIIDPVLDYDSATNKISTHSAHSILSLVKDRSLTVERLLETHVHADHLTASHYLKTKLAALQASPPAVCIGADITKIQRDLAPRYKITQAELDDSFDETYSEGDRFNVGSLDVSVIELAGHTPNHVGYVIGSNVFVGDSIFNPDVGSARVDFPKGSASALWTSMQFLLSLPDHFKLYTGHDYPPEDREYGGQKGQPRPYATVEEHKQSNKHAKSGTVEDEFVQWRTTRDNELRAPKLLHQSLQVNLLGGRFPTATGEQPALLAVPVQLPEDFSNSVHEMKVKL
ncbi:Metallo-hydrolase/oxidoreductase, partial [Aureobasidium melanogenum]